MRKPTTPDKLREAAEHYQNLSRMVSDERALEALQQLASDYDQAADHIELWEAIRARAYRIWIEQGRPEGRAVEHWRVQNKK